MISVCLSLLLIFPQHLTHVSFSTDTFYSNKFHKLISNGSDALDQTRYASLTDPSVLDSSKDLYICITPEKKNKILSFCDTVLA